MNGANHPTTLRVRLFQLALIAILPALAVILYSAGEQRIKDSQNAERDALRLARVIAVNYSRQIDNTRHLLTALASLSEVRKQDGAACSRLFAILLKE
ncbi:MAG TPA: hypothetical protein VNT76_06895, partial [Candidatus Binatus sp.]|nr:hypothetical protein [Candidatus Binatus sp.]